MVDSESEFMKKITKVAAKFDKDQWERMPSARFSFWSRRELWTLIEFACLLEGKEPINEVSKRPRYIPSYLEAHYEEIARSAIEAIALGVLEPVNLCPDANIAHILLSPMKWLEWAKRKEFTIHDEFLHLLDSNEPGTDVVENRISPSILPGDLSVVVDDVNQTVSICSQSNYGEKTKYARNDIVGKGTVTWDLLVAFAKCNGSLEGNATAVVKEINKSANRKNLGNKLMLALNLDKSPIVEGRNGVMCFHSIQLAGGTSSADAMDRKTCSYNDQTTEFLRRNGEDIPVID